MAHPKDCASLDFAQVVRNMSGVPAARSRLFACLALLLLATVGVLAADHCACDDVSADCEHAGQACAQPDDCSDCLVPSDPAALADAMVALLPPANVLVGAPLLVPVSSACLEGGDDVSAGLIRYSVGGLSALHPCARDGRRV